MYNRTQIITADGRQYQQNKRKKPEVLYMPLTLFHCSMKNSFVHDELNDVNNYVFKDM
jgi:hypothetical protein